VVAIRLQEMQAVRALQIRERCALTLGIVKQSADRASVCDRVARGRVVGISLVSHRLIRRRTGRLSAILSMAVSCSEHPISASQLRDRFTARRDALRSPWPRAAERLS
jgi:hypothetical protein